MKTSKNRGSKKWVFSALTLLFIAILLNGCYKDKGDKLYPGSNAPACDTLAMKYSANISPLLMQNCATAGCHTSNNKPGAGGYAFDSHIETMTSVTNGKLVKSIKHVAGTSAMPKGGGQLGDCDINKIVAWINQGALNN